MMRLGGLGKGQGDKKGGETAAGCGVARVMA